LEVSPINPQFKKDERQVFTTYLAHAGGSLVGAPETPFQIAEAEANAEGAGKIGL